MIDLSNHNVREINTPIGKGTYFGISPDVAKVPEQQEITVMLPGARAKTFTAGQCEELEEKK